MVSVVIWHDSNVNVQPAAGRFRLALVVGGLSLDIHVQRAERLAIVDSWLSCCLLHFLLPDWADRELAHNLIILELWGPGEHVRVIRLVVTAIPNGARLFDWIICRLTVFDLLVLLC